ncbi:MAG TPA: hypothetical protein VFS19_01165 [Planctomycetota bacterium]|nr:hypothetical protein [Planctomycetota bacterium]
MTDMDDDDDIRLGKCPRCGAVDARKVKEVSKFAASLGDADDEESEHCFPLTTCTACGLGGVARTSIRGGYYNRELREVVDELPSMGRPCLHCGARIPKFLDLDPEEGWSIRRQERSEGEEAAISSLMAATGCPRAWARIWLAHPFGPRRPKPSWAGPPCSYCGRPLRTLLARQCLECGTDWHDPDNVRKL